MSELTPRQRRGLWLRLALFAGAWLLLFGVMHAPRERLLSIVPLELAQSAAAFKELAVKGWQEDTPAEGGAPSFWRLRGNLFVDSVLLVPAYVALLLFFTMGFMPRRPEHAIRRQLIGVPAVAAGLFDVAENGMTGRALDDLIDLALVDATVADVTLAARLKWALLGVALALLAWRVFASRDGDRLWRTVAAAFSALAALAFWFGAARSSPVVLDTALACAVLPALALLSWRALRRAPVS